jgi:signal transduction histidine kinase
MPRHGLDAARLGTDRRRKVTKDQDAAALRSALERERLAQGALAAERARADDEARTARLLATVVAGTRVLLDAPDFEPALRDWLRLMCDAQGAVSASYYDVVIHPDAGVQTHRCLAEYSPYPPGEMGRKRISFAQPLLIDPRGAEALLAANARGEVAAFHTNDLRGPLRLQMESQGHATTIVAPMLDGPAMVGAISFDYWQRRELDPRNEVILRTAADALAAVLKRREAEAARLVTERARADEAREAAAQLARRRDLLEAVVAASDELLAADRVVDAAPLIVVRLGTALAADRAAIGRCLPPDATSAAGYLEFFAEWTAPGIPRQLADPTLTTFDMAKYPEFNLPLHRGEAVHMLTDDIAGAAARSEQEATGARSQFQYPIMVDGVLWGTIGADDCRTPRVWDEAEIATLRLVASALGSLVRRERLVDAALAAERQAATERERAEAARAQALLQERARMAREIHDTLAQSFTGIVLQGEAARARRAHGEEAVAWEHLEQSTKLAKFGLSEARRSVLALRPLVLEQRGLVPALQDLAARVAIPEAFDCAVEVPVAFGRLAAADEDALFRVVQEALTNALRHGSARRVTVRLVRHGGGVEMTVRDDGSGFDPALVQSAATGHGLENAAARIAALGGQLDVETSPGRGVRIVVHMPVRP